VSSRHTRRRSGRAAILGNHRAVDEATSLARGEPSPDAQAAEARRLDGRSREVAPTKYPLFVEQTTWRQALAAVVVFTLVAVAVVAGAGDRGWIKTPNGNPGVVSMEAGSDSAVLTAAQRTRQAHLMDRSDNGAKRSHVFIVPALAAALAIGMTVVRSASRLLEARPELQRRRHSMCLRGPPVTLVASI
jgi:hypothetical protein